MIFLKVHQVSAVYQMRSGSSSLPSGSQEIPTASVPEHGVLQNKNTALHSGRRPELHELPDLLPSPLPTINNARNADLIHFLQQARNDYVEVVRSHYELLKQPKQNKEVIKSSDIVVEKSYKAYEMLLLRFVSAAPANTDTAIDNKKVSLKSEPLENARR